MKLKLLIPIFLLSLLLVGCTTQEVPKTEGTVGSDSIIESKVETTTSKTTEADIRVIDGKLDPRDITLTIGEEKTLTIHNMQENEVRIDIPMYGSEVSVDIPADSYEVITLNPKYAGFVAIELNGNQLGTIIVE